jgi:hypothetical protein
VNKLAASMKDRSAKSWSERRMYYKVGSCFKGCQNCGEVAEDESGRLRFVSGYEVFRAYRPWQTGFTWLCMECGAKDLGRLQVRPRGDQEGGESGDGPEAEADEECHGPRVGAGDREVEVVTTRRKLDDGKRSS